MAQTLSSTAFYIDRHCRFKRNHQNFTTKSLNNMNYLQATQEITVAIPEICSDLKEKKIQNSYHIVEFLTDKIKTMIRQDNTSCLFRCIQKMNELYSEGDSSMKGAIENSFIYSLDHCTAFCSREYRDHIFSQLSDTLQKVYFRQIYSHHI